MIFFRKTDKKKTFDRENKKPVIRVSICTGEQVAGFRDVHTGKFEEVMLLKDDKDMAEFKKIYDIQGEIEKIY